MDQTLNTMVYTIMAMMKLNFTIPEDVVAGLKDSVALRNRSAFVSTAIREKLDWLAQEKLRQALIEGYQARRDEDAEIDREWEQATLEGWG